LQLQRMVQLCQPVGSSRNSRGVFHSQASFHSLFADLRTGIPHTFSVYHQESPVETSPKRLITQSSKPSCGPAGMQPGSKDQDAGYIRKTSCQSLSPVKPKAPAVDRPSQSPGNCILFENNGGKPLPVEFIGFVRHGQPQYHNLGQRFTAMVRQRFSFPSQSDFFVKFTRRGFNAWPGLRHGLSATRPAAHLGRPQKEGVNGQLQKRGRMAAAGSPRDEPTR
jgi:hypothetical protein